MTALGVEDVGRDRRRCSAALGHRYPRSHGDLEIGVGDLAFSARWEPAAPQTIEAIRRMLPIRRQLIHCRWSGESTWIPYGEFRPGIDYENHTSHPAPGHARDVPGRDQRVRDLLPIRGVHDARRRSASSPPTTSPRSSRTRAGQIGCARSGGAACGTAPRRSRSARRAELGVSAHPRATVHRRGRRPRSDPAPAATRPTLARPAAAATPAIRPRAHCHPGPRSPTCSYGHPQTLRAPMYGRTRFHTCSVSRTRLTLAGNHRLESPRGHRQVG